MGVGSISPELKKPPVLNGISFPEPFQKSFGRFFSSRRRIPFILAFVRHVDVRRNVFTLIFLYTFCQCLPCIHIFLSHPCPFCKYLACCSPCNETCSPMVAVCVRQLVCNPSRRPPAARTLLGFEVSRHFFFRSLAGIF